MASPAGQAAAVSDPAGTGRFHERQVFSVMLGSIVRFGDEFSALSNVGTAYHVLVSSPNSNVHYEGLAHCSFSATAIHVRPQ